MSKYDNAGLVMIPSGYKASKVYSVIPNTADGDFDFARASTATRVNKDGLIETVASGVPRLNYPLIDGVVQDCPSLLLEPSRTNLITYSEDFDDAAWSKSNATITSNNVISPDGTLNASSVEFTAGGYLLESVTTTKTIGSSETISVFSKTDVSGTFLKYGGGTASGTDVEKKEDYGNGWFRYSVTRTFTEAETASSQIIISSSDVGLNIAIFGAQLEVGSYPTSYIPTSGATVTRLAETCSGAGNASTFNDSEGVLMAEFSNISENNNATVSISLSDGTTNNCVSLYYFATSGVYYDIFNSDGTRSGSAPMTKIQQTYNNKIALKYKSGDIALWINGIKLNTNNATLNLSNLSEVNLHYGNGNFPFYGNTKQIQYFNTALTDAELAALTS